MRLITAAVKGASLAVDSHADNTYIAAVVGTRPEIVKVAHIERMLGSRARLLHTRQHADEELSGVFISAAGLPDPEVLSGVCGEPRHAQIGRIGERDQAGSDEDNAQEGPEHEVADLVPGPAATHSGGGGDDPDPQQVPDHQQGSRAARALTTRPTGSLRGISSRMPSPHSGTISRAELQ
jgi:hypothetical protein